MWEEDLHPAREVCDLFAVASAILPKLVDVFFMGLGSILEGYEGFPSGHVVPALCASFYANITEFGQDATPVGAVLHVSLEAVSGDGGEEANVSHEGVIAV